MATNKDLLITIEYYLDVTKDDAWNTQSHSEAQAALETLRQRISDLEAFYQHMISDEHHYEYLASIEAYQQRAANFADDDEYTRLGIDAQLFRDLLARVNGTQS